MSRRVSIGDIIFLVVALAALALLWRFLSPPAEFVLACLGAGASLPILSRVVRRFLPKSLWVLPVILLITVTSSLSHRFPILVGRPGVFFGVLASAFAVGVGVAEFSLRPFFPIKRVEKQT
jgi:hypothetical protein